MYRPRPFDPPPPPPKDNFKVVDLEALSVFKTLQDMANESKFVAVDGDKVLSSNDFTDEEKQQLANLTANLEGYQVADLEDINAMLDDVFGDSSNSEKHNCTCCADKDDEDLNNDNDPIEP